MVKQSGFYSRISKLTENFEVLNGFLVASNFGDCEIAKECQNFREKVTVTDLSFFQKFEITGFDAAILVAKLFNKELLRLSVQQLAKSIFQDSPNTKILDEGSIYRLCYNHFRWVGKGIFDYNSFFQKKIANWKLTAYITPSTNRLNNLAILGPLSKKLLQKIIWTPPNQPKISQLHQFYFLFARLETEQGISLVISRIDFLGILGYEIFCPPENANVLWDLVMQAGAEFDLAPLGFEAFKKLKTEADYANFY